MTTLGAERVRSGTTMSIRDVSLFVEVVGRGYPLLLMHGGPGADHWTMLPFRRCADRFTLIFYDHRCNGRSEGAPVSSMTWENLTADAEALRQRLGFERWAVLGHSFGGHVALEYALRYPDSLSHLVLLDTGGDSRWARENAADLLAKRGYSPEKVELVRRFFNGQIAPKAMLPALMRFGSAYYHHPSILLLAREDAAGSADLRRSPPAQGLDGHGSAQRDHGADAGDGGTGRLPVPARASGGACGRNPERAPPDHRARGSQSALGAARRGHAGRQRLHLPGRAFWLTRMPATEGPTMGR